MPTSKLIKVMISSRCNDQIMYQGTLQELSVVRKELKREIETYQLFGKDLFEVWINETAPPSSRPSWDECMKQTREANILISLYNGNPGWAQSSGDIGICHAELATAINAGSGKVRMVHLLTEPAASDPAESDQRDRFKDYVDKQSLFRGGSVANTGEELIALVKEALHDALINMVWLGDRETRKGKYDSGEALDWSRLDYKNRKKQIESEVEIHLLSKRNAEKINDDIYLTYSGKKLLFKVHSIPAAFGISSARELVGRPFLSDHLEMDNLKKTKQIGPIHIIACHKSITENQAISMLGFPDATVVTPTFGVYVADRIQKIQLVFLANCRDITSTRHAVQRFFDWIDKTGESNYLIERSIARKKIVKAISDANT